MITLLSFFYLIFNPGCITLSDYHPDGGAKDTTPPVLLSSIPSDGDTFFSDNKIKLIFDKEIDVRNLKNELIILPALDEKDQSFNNYTYKVKGKVIEIKLKKPLRDKTTYVLNFQNSILSVNEGNKVDNLSLSFSTGDQIDTLYINGSVKDIMNKKVMPNMFVSLYLFDDKLNLFNSYPRYFTKTDSNGNFILKNLSSNKYFLYASDRIKYNKNVNMDILKCGIFDYPIDLTKPIENINIDVQDFNFNKLSINKTYSSIKYFDIYFNKPIEKYEIEKINLKDGKDLPRLYSNIINDNVLRIYNQNYPFGEEENINIKDEIIEDITVNLKVFDYSNDVFNQECSIFFDKANIKGRKEKLQYRLTPNFMSNLKNPIKFSLNLNKPIKDILLDNWSIIFDHIATIYISKQDISFNNDNTQINIEKYLSDDIINKINSLGKQNINFKINIPSDSLYTIESDKITEIKGEYIFNVDESLGSIKGHIRTNNKNYLIQLLDKDFKLVKELKNEKSYEFNNLLPQEYIIRILVLRDGEGKWNKGDIKNNIPADKVIMYPELIKVIPKWEVHNINFDF